MNKNFNNPLNLYEKISNLQAIELLYQYYKDDRIVEKIEKNLKLLNEDLNIKRIHKKMHDYLKLSNKEAKKIYETITLAYVKDWYNYFNQRKTQLRGQNSYIAPRPYWEYQVDLFFYPNNHPQTLD